MSASERKLVAILHADVVGYSRLMAEDEDGTLRALAECRAEVERLIHQHRGRLVDFTGDAFLAEFPSGLDAVRCAAAAQQALEARDPELAPEQRMRFRMGVHLGDVRVEGDAIFGDGVNIAARLQSLAEPGGICISSSVHEQVRAKLDLEFEDLGEKGVKNIPGSLRVFALARDGTRRGRRTLSRGWRVAAWAGAGVVAVALALALAWRPLLGLALDATGLSGPPVEPPVPDIPSIVVLPFENMSADPAQEYFADGMAEEITAALSRAIGLFVISRSSAFTYKGQAVKVDQVGRELGVRYVLEGSVRRDSDRVRITAQLIDAQSGYHLWSAQYDRQLADVFRTQTEIAEEILGALKLEIDTTELARIRRKPIEDLTTYELFLKGSTHLARLRREDAELATGYFEEVTTREPEIGAGYAMRSLALASEYGMGWDRDPELMERAEQLAERALELDPDAFEVQLAAAGARLFRGRSADALRASERAVEIAPNEDSGHMLRGAALLQQGRYLAALQAAQRAVRLNPRSPSPTWVVMGFANSMVGRDDEAADLWRRAVAANPDMIMARVALVANHAHEGREGEARAQVREILRINPELTAEQAIRVMQGDADVIGAAQTREVLAHLRRAGMP